MQKNTAAKIVVVVNRCRGKLVSSREYYSKKLLKPEVSFTAKTVIK